MSDEESDRPFSDKLHHHIKSLSESMGLGSDFLHDLDEEDDDWSFVVKLHAVLEAAVNELLKAKLAEPGLASMLIGRLQLQSRIDILETIGVIDKDASKRMGALAKLRNKLVHDVHQTKFKFLSLVDTVGKRKDFAETYIAADLRKLVTDDHPDWRARSAMWLSVIYIIALTVTEMRSKRAMDGLRQALANETKRGDRT